MRLVMMGTGPFAVPTFRALYETHHVVAALVTGPLRWHRGKLVEPVSPIRDIAHEHGTPVFDPEDVNAAASRSRLAEFQPELLVVCDYGQILSATTLATAPLGGVNLHGSLLPKYRGAAPIHWAIYHGERETGVSVIHMTPQVDAGPVIAQAPIEIDPDETADQLEARLAELGGWLMRRAIDAVETGRLEAMPQDPKQASRAPRLKKSDGVVDWSCPAQALKNQVRALEPWPKCYTFWLRDDGLPVRLILGPVDVVDASSPDVQPGTVLEAAGDRIVIATGEGAIAPRALQPAGKRMMRIAEFLRGNRVKPGDRFGDG
ncbi:MAG: methionyl-tRNA formyltransferase [Thermoguttaceae bacterium]|jgi:methionyl-tRNA formyltransferase|nr:methionyl-tRNA formyltransferase [Thermoguttaceae bacterium]